MKASTKDKILLILGGVFLTTLLGLLIFDVTRRGVFKVKMGINVIVVGDEGASLLILRPEEGVVSWIKLQKNIKIKAFDSEAQYPLESLWGYGVSLKNPFEIIEKSLGQSMGIVISRTIKIGDSSLIENVLGSLFKIDLKTDLSIRDRVMIRRFLADAAKSKRILEFTIPENVFDKVTDPDGKEFLEFNSTMSLWTKNKFIIESILDENTDISINNISGISGAGNILSRQLESTGMHVVEVMADLEETIGEGKDCLYSTIKLHEMTEIVLKEQVGCKKIAKPGFMEEDESRIKVWIK